MRTLRFLWAKKSKSIHAPYATFAATASWVNCFRFECPDPEVVARRLSPNYADGSHRVAVIHTSNTKRTPLCDIPK